MDDSLTLATIRGGTWSVLNMQHITPNSERWDYADFMSTEPWGINFSKIWINKALLIQGNECGNLVCLCEACPWRSNWKWDNFVSDNALAPNSQHAITFTNYGLSYWRLYASLCLHVLLAYHTLQFWSLSRIVHKYCARSGKYLVEWVKWPLGIFSQECVEEVVSSRDHHFTINEPWWSENGKLWSELQNIVHKCTKTWIPAWISNHMPC